MMPMQNTAFAFGAVTPQIAPFGPGDRTPHLQAGSETPVVPMRPQMPQMHADATPLVNPNSIGYAGGVSVAGYAAGAVTPFVPSGQGAFGDVTPMVPSAPTAPTIWAGADTPLVR